MMIGGTYKLVVCIRNQRQTEYESFPESGGIVNTAYEIFWDMKTFEYFRKMKTFA